MNVANLQIEGLCLALAALNRALAAKGMLSHEEIDAALAEAEMAAAGDGRTGIDITPAQGDAIAFPVRLLRRANMSEGPLPNFQTFARQVGESKPRG